METTAVEFVKENITFVLIYIPLEVVIPGVLDNGCPFGHLA